MNKSTILGMTLLVFVMGGVFVIRSSESVDAKTDLSVVNTPTYLATSSLPVPVVGTVRATDTATIYAQTAGVVTALPYVEGSEVGVGTPLVQQHTPVASAQVALAQAQAGLAAVERSAAVASSDDRLSSASARAYSAEELATLRARANNRRIAEVVDTSLVTTKANSATALAAMDFITSNRSLFTADGLRLYEASLRQSYGLPPSYFNGGVLYGAPKVTSLRETLTAIQQNDEASLVEIETAATLMVNVLETLNQVLETGERDVFQRGVTSIDATTKAEYLAQKTSVSEALAALSARQQAIQQIVDATLEDALSQDLAVTVSELDRTAAETQRDFAREIADWSGAVAMAGVGVAGAEQSLGTVRAPFAGVVSRVLIEAGEYALPGTPILELIGDGAREIEVSVPATFGQHILVGQPFVVDGEVVGVVDRVSPTTVGRGQTVFITLTAPLFSVGESIRGVIMTEPTEILHVVPRSFVHFSSDGAFVRYENGIVSPVRIVHDAVTDFYLRVETVKPEALVPVLGVSL